MSIATAINNAKQKIARAYQTVSDMGGTLPATQNLENLPTAIETVQSGGSGSITSLIDGSIDKVDTDASSIRGGAFANCTNLSEAFLRSPSKVNLSDTSIFENTPIASRNGIIYVPGELLEDYKNTITGSNNPNDFRVATKRSTLSSESIVDICFNGTNFVGISRRGYLSKCSDGLLWTTPVLTNLSSNLDWTSLVFYSDDTYVGLRKQSTTMSVIYSSNSVTSEGLPEFMQIGTVPNLISDNSWVKLCKGDSLVLGISQQGYLCYIRNPGSSNPTITSSSNTVLGSHQWISLAYNGSNYIALGEKGFIASSSDGLSWTTPVQNSNLRLQHDWKDITFARNQFVAITSDGYTSISKDGLNWTPPALISNLGGHKWEAISYGNDYLAVTSNLSYVSSTCGASIYNYASISEYELKNKFSTFSTPEKDYGISRLSGNEIMWTDMTYANGKFVLLGTHAQVSTSVDGLNWTPPSFANGDPTITGANAITTYGASGFYILTSSGIITTSSDGISWSRPTVVNVLANGNANWQTLTFGNSKFVALGWNTVFDPTIGKQCGYVATSTNGSNWSVSKVSQLNYGKWVSIAYGNSRFVALSYNGNFSVSENGIDWVQYRSTETTFDWNWYKLIFINNTFVAFSDHGNCVMSFDGINWYNRVWNDKLNPYSSWYGAFATDGSKVVGVSQDSYVTAPD